MKEAANHGKIRMESTIQQTAQAEPLFRRILTPTDFSQRSQTAVDYAVEIARRMHARLTLLHVLPEPSIFDYTLGGFPQEEWKQAKEEAARNLAEAVAHAKRTFLEVDAKLGFGSDLRNEIWRTAKKMSADLLVLSTHEYSGWKHWLVGSDAEKILKDAPCPILIVR